MRTEACRGAREQKHSSLSFPYRLNEELFETVWSPSCPDFIFRVELRLIDNSVLSGLPCSFFFFFWPHHVAGMWDLSSLTKDQIHILCIRITES